MPLNSVTTSTTIYATAPSLQAGYNDIRSLLVDILGTGSNGYGYQAIPSSAVANTEIIRAQDWTNLINNTSICYEHHNNSPFSFSNTPVSGQTPKASFVNQLITVLNGVEAVRYNRPPVGQRSTSSATSQWTVSAPSRLAWGALIEHEVTFTWNNANDARYFFNLGGRLSFSLTYPVEPYNPGDLEWKALIDSNASAMAAYIYTRTDFLTGNKTTAWSDVNGNQIAITYTKINDQTIRLLLSLSNTQPSTDLEVTNTFIYEYSTGAINAPQPATTVQKSLGDTTIPIVLPTKVLSVSTPSAYSWVTGQTSSAQTVNITNSGNSTATVSSITFSNASGITQVTNFTGLGGSTTFTLDPSQTKSFTLAYSGSAIGGPYNSSFTVNSNNDTGPITIATSQTITRIPFGATISPASISTVLTNFDTVIQDFLIQSTNGDTFTYGAELLNIISPPGAVGWTLEQGTSRPVGPRVSFSPAGTNVGSFSASVNLFVNVVSSVSGENQTFLIPFIVDCILPTSGNLGTWLSPMGPDNSVIGISYDVVGPERYLTIGIGMGADGSVQLNQGGIGSVDVNNLGLSGDPNPNLGQPLYPATYSTWGGFLNVYGSWPTPVNGEPRNINVAETAKYRIKIPSNGRYYYEMSSDDDSQFYLIKADQYGIVDNDALPIFLTPSLTTGGNQSNWKQSYLGNVDLEAGNYILGYFNNNLSGPAAAAFQFTTLDTVIWNTRYPVRSAPIYPYWADVMRFRIPADGTPREQYSSYAYVKNSYQAGNKAHWGYYFQGDLFKVTDDGAGNVSVEIFGTPYSPQPSDPGYLTTRETVRSLNSSFYYYLPSNILNRYNNLESGPTGDGTQTKFFTGFDRSGNVTTVLRSIPTSPIPYPPSLSSGGGDGGGGRPGEFDEFTNINLS
jgi:hypothetical protein